MPPTRKVVLSGAVAAIAVAVAVIAARLLGEDPLAALPREPPDAPVVEGEVWREHWNGRVLLHVALEGTAVGRVQFAVSLPDPVPATPVPLAVVLGGLRGGSNAIRELSEVAGDPGPNAVVGFDWPLPARDPGVAELVARSFTVRRGALSVPGQIDLLLRWALRQPWADPERVSLLGYSLGGFAVPAAQRLIELRGGSVGWTVLAYAGAPIGSVVATHPKLRPRWLADALGAATDLLLRPIEPSNHLPHLHGRFLLVGGRTDRFIAPAAAERLRALAPEPKAVALLGGEHMGVGAKKDQLFREVVAVTRSWLVEQGAIEPPPSAR
ncbi:MAG TPA: hypothetical protein VM753_18390 [Anaeromyxobacter sp.]|nr:hypothetical protein [Anaeromyxobacter sp.]